MLTHAISFPFKIAPVLNIFCLQKMFVDVSSYFTLIRVGVAVQGPLVYYTIHINKIFFQYIANFLQIQKKKRKKMGMLSKN